MIRTAYIQELIQQQSHLDEVDASEADLIEMAYIREHSPVKIKGLDKGWKTSNWTLDFFKDKKGHLEFPVRRRLATGGMEERNMSLAAFIDYMIENEKAPEASPFYLNTTFGPTDDMLQDYTLPTYFSCLFQNFREIPDKTTLSWIYLAPQHSVTPLHIDTIASSAWNLVISGLKFWVFYPPAQNPLLYGGEVNPFAPDFAQHPLYKKAEPIVCLQRPGETIFTPSGWYHAVLNLKMGVSLTENFINETNIDKVKAYCDAVGIPTEGMYEAMSK